MTNPFANMIGWIFKQGMAAVALDEKFKAIDARFAALEGRLDERFKSIDERFKAVDAKFDHLDEKVDLVRSEIGAKVEGLRGEMKASIDLHERIASIEARMPQKSA
jgi:tetrahydromethanopterin S-methyltransferase subunit G